MSSFVHVLYSHCQVRVVNNRNRVRIYCSQRILIHLEFSKCIQITFLFPLTYVFLFLFFKSKKFTIRVGVAVDCADAAQTQCLRSRPLRCYFMYLNMYFLQFLAFLPLCCCDKVVVNKKLHFRIIATNAIIEILFSKNRKSFSWVSLLKSDNIIAVLLSSFSPSIFSYTLNWKISLTPYKFGLRFYPSTYFFKVQNLHFVWKSNEFFIINIF